jgi:hypothetical protein
MKVKYPKTFHLPFSPGLTNDDKVIKTLVNFDNREVVVTEKMDGENTTLYRDYCHARSLDSRHHESRNWIKRFHGEIAHKIPADWRICGENLYAQHSISYTDLLSYFYGFSIFDNVKNTAFDWDSTLYSFSELGIVPVKELYRGKFDIQLIQDLAESLDTSKQEGLVVRIADEFHFDDFNKSVVKWVRHGHVQTDEHWMLAEIIPNNLRLCSNGQ